MTERLTVNVDFSGSLYAAAKYAAVRENKSFQEYVNACVAQALETIPELDAVEVMESIHPQMNDTSTLAGWKLGIITGNILARNYVQEREYARDPEMMEIRHLFIQDAHHLFQAAKALGGATYATFKCRIIRDWPSRSLVGREPPHPLSWHIPLGIY